MHNQDKESAQAGQRKQTSWQQLVYKLKYP